MRLFPVKAALKESDYTEEELEEIFTSIDVNKNGHIVYTGMFCC